MCFEVRYVLQDRYYEKQGDYHVGTGIVIQCRWVSSELYGRPGPVFALRAGDLTDGLFLTEQYTVNT